MRNGLGLSVPLGIVAAGCSAMPSASTTTAISTSTTRMVSTPTIDGVPAPDPWTSSELTVTPDGLGAVRVGMTLSEAQQAAGVTFGDVGDGFDHAPTGNPRLRWRAWRLREALEEQQIAEVVQDDEIRDQQRFADTQWLRGTHGPCGSTP